jgi:hypothetical protein
MNVRRRDFLLLATLAAAAATPALGQGVTPAVGPTSNAARSTAYVPDFSGIWAHLIWPDVEPPLSGPGPVRNTARRDGASDVYLLIGDYTNPILKPHAAEAVKKAGEIARTGVTAPTPANQCWPDGVPFIFWNIGMQMLQEPDRITILYANDNESRRVRMNVSHPAHVTPSWHGDSVGHYEGDTLVIDTVGVRADRPFAMVDMYGTPHTEALHVVERYRLLDHEAATEAEERGERGNFHLPSSDTGFARNPSYKGKGLELQFTVEDEGVFTTPWSASIIYQEPSSPLGQWPEFVCADNRHEYYSGQDTAVPHADKPDF